MGVRQLSRSLGEYLLPRHCVLCAGRCGRNICGPCESDLPRNHQSCYRCGIPLNLLAPVPGPSQVCGACMVSPPPFDRTIAALDYAFPVTVLVQRFKFSRSFASGVVLANCLLAVIESMRDTGERLPQVLVPVPLHPFRRFRRVFNQAEVVACDLGRALGIPVQPRLLKRTRYTRSQPGLSARARHKNLGGAITARPTQAQHVAIIDDVMTTGATVSECARELKRVGVKSVSVWVAARARGP